MESTRKSKLIPTALIIVMLTAVPALAGNCVAKNFSKDTAYFVHVDNWLLGVLEDYGFCVKPGETGRSSLAALWYFYAIGKIEVYESSNNTCSSGYYEPEVLKSYTPSGTYWFTRDFSVIIQTDGQIFITED